jgi:hypothetical protein
MHTLLSHIRGMGEEEKKNFLTVLIKVIIISGF